MRLANLQGALSFVFLLAATPAGALEITSISPEPLISGAMAQLAGGPFVAEDLTVTLDGASQEVQVAQESQVLFEVDSSIPLGASLLRVETGGEAVELEVEISAPPPTIGNVMPLPVVMGQSASITGSDFAAVNDIFLNMVPCEITAQTDVQMAFVVPLEAAVLGTATLRLETAAWHTEMDIQVKAPSPSIDSLSPNPVRQGDLLTLTGTIIPGSMVVSVGAQDATIFSAEFGQVVVQVPDSQPPGPAEVIVHHGDVASEPVGPLHVQEASSKRPVIDRVAPANLVQGGSVWLFGDEMDQVEWASEGLTLADCDDKACQVTPEGDGLGQLKGAVGGAEGTDIFTLQVLADVLVVPELTSLEPNPAFRGQTLTLRGEGLHQVNAVFVGGVEQPIDYVDVDRVEITLSGDTPMGAERAMVAGGSGSNPLVVTVLEPLETPEVDVVDDTVEGEADADAGPQLDSGLDEQSTGDGVHTDDVPSQGGARSSDGGCQGGGATPLLSLALIMLALGLRRRMT